MTATLSTIAREIEYDLYSRGDRASSLMSSDRGQFAAAQLKVERPIMLTMKRSGADRSTFLDRWETHVLLRDAAEIGRIEIHANEGHVTVQGSQFHCRIQPRGRQRLTFIPARWVMYAGETELHAARSDGSRTFLVDEVPGLGLLRLRREGLLRAGYAIDRMPDERRIGEARFLRGRLLPRPRAPQYQLETEQELPVTFEIFLAWIVVQAGLDSG